MDENLSYKKQTKIFITIAVIVHAVLASAISLVTDGIDTANPTLESVLKLYLPGVAVAVVKLVLYFFIGKKLTADKRKTMIFMASLYSGILVVNAVSEILPCTAESLSSLGYIHPDILSAVTVAVNILRIPFAVMLANYTFTAFEGHNDTESLDDSQLTLSRAKNRYIAYELIGGIVISLLATLPTFVLSYLINSVYNNTPGAFSAITANVSSIFSSLAGILIIYVAGYKPYKSHLDGMAFIACYEFANGINSIFISLLTIPQILAFNNFTTSVTESAYDITGVASISVITGIFTLLTTALSIITPVLLMKYFFSNKNTALF